MEDRGKEIPHIMYDELEYKTESQILLELADKAGRPDLAFMLLQQGDITLVDYLKHLNGIK